MRLNLLAIVALTVAGCSSNPAQDVDRRISAIESKATETDSVLRERVETLAAELKSLREQLANSKPTPPQDAPKLPRDATFDEVTTSSLALRDQNGRVRARLCINDGSPALTLFMDNGKVGAKLGLSTGGSVLLLFDSGARPAVSLSSLVDGNNLSLRYPGRKRGIEMGANEFGTHAFWTDENGGLRAQVVYEVGENDAWMDCRAADGTPTFTTRK